MSSYDCLIIGAGVIGLACASRLARSGQRVLVVEEERLIGSHTSSRNSEVIHAGIYYTPDSLKARLCVEGRDLLYRWCTDHHVEHRRIGKLLVAVSSDEIAALDALQKNAQQSGVDSLQEVGAAQLRQMEPAVSGVAALLSMDTGIIDSHAYLMSLLGDAQRHSADLALETRVERLHHDGKVWIVEGESCDEPFSVDVQRVINAAGLFSSQLATRIDGLEARHVPTTQWCRGRYFSYSGSSPFTRLIYPMPEVNTAGLGVHATIDMGGQVRFGPDVAWTDSIDYQVEESLKSEFSVAIQRYFPGLDPQRLTPGYCGIRPKLSGPGQPAGDFLIQGSQTHGLPGLVNLYGIESPGLTASLAIADHVARIID
ncbi:MULTISPECIES: NAD(P)/FAD-dependent oxidoreductase [Pseudomonas]|uniref:NAD(P)/FAD-dependent oxidoreductase n=1 Tax=Pseudomonas TaxID=286 RepID=UPI001C6553B4|nr:MULTISPECIES: NAD(P)/FAD-dependent oxidoreductase [unclassified Pseudomonas]MBW8126358.1 NAD(P)/FAD-dependent oxidoreductase [Pseudomonas sp. LAP_36]MBW8136027.1 NAD(P)/FAD-dependent oxidoreductase [Pseudomonas sp. PAMC 26818]